MALSLSETAVLISSALSDNDVRAMRKINDRCIEETAIRFQQPTYQYALISYVLSKILTKPRYIKAQDGKSKISQIAALLCNCEVQAKSADYRALLATQEKVLATIEKMDEDDPKSYGKAESAVAKTHNQKYAEAMAKQKAGGKK